MRVAADATHSQNILQDLGRQASQSAHHVRLCVASFRTRGLCARDDWKFHHKHTHNRTQHGALRLYRVSLIWLILQEAHTHTYLSFGIFMRILSEYIHTQVNGWVDWGCTVTLRVQQHAGLIYYGIDFFLIHLLTHTESFRERG